MSRYFIKYFLIIISLIIYSQDSKAAMSDFAQGEYAQIRLISSHKQDYQEKNQIIIAFEFKLDKNWQIYGNLDDKSATSFAQPPEFFFNGSKNIDINNYEILWPKAKINKEDILGEEIKYSTYEGSFAIPIKLNIIDKNKDIELKTEVNYALCNEICIPASQNIVLNIDKDDFDNKSLQIIDKSLKNQQFSNENNLNIAENSNISLFLAIILAFIGGFILNFMPCVLPVLSLKLISVLEHSKSSIKKIRLAYISTIFGILFSFITFAAIAYILKYLGNNVGWGTQFQNPYFVIFLAIILTIFSANLLNLFEINLGSSLSNIINKKINKNKDQHDILHVIFTNFLSGILVVLLATPCSAPFVGSAISFAFTQDSLALFIIFIFMGLGLSLPYFILIIFPKMIKILPKPGNWMNYLRILMAFFLISTVIWLIFILSNNIGSFGAYSIAILLILSVTCLIIAKKLAISETKRKFLIIILAFVTFYSPNITAKYSQITSKYDELWVNFDKDQIMDYVNSGKVVIIDITADWCLTCKANKKIVLDSAEIVKLLEDDDIIGMRGDLTKPDMNITNFMNLHGRYGIPFNIVFGPNAKNGIKTSELLSKKHLINIIEQAK
ncbi:thioredoxin family protein [Rickettsiales bacterium]|nr:thioredoxin family protein [Rickettsiales bacterium]